LFAKTFGPKEIEQSYREYAAVLILFARAIVDSRERAQDIVQQMFLRLMDRPVARPENPKAYLFAAVRNTAMNELRSNRRMVEFDAGEAWFDAGSSGGDRDVWTERNLRHALCSLPEEQREVTILHIWGELTFPEVGQVLGISANTAASRYRYALQHLREELTERKG
jgi:RNA polymerase sigma-70 factor (ECF subfamily)